MHTSIISAETAERRRKQLEDLQKRNSYKKAHGIDISEGIGVWVPGQDVYAPNPARSAGIAEAVRVPVKMDGARQEPQDAAMNVRAEDSTYVDFEGKKRPVKKWLGIW